MSLKNGELSDNDDNVKRGMYDEAGKLKKMKHEQQKENEAEQVIKCKFTC